MLVLPLMLLETAWYITVMQFALLHFIAGLTLASIFQPAHVVPSTKYPLPDENGNYTREMICRELAETLYKHRRKKIFLIAHIK